MNVTKFPHVENAIIIINGTRAILDVDVAHIYGVETKRINEAVKNNPDKFPDGYVFELSKQDLADLRSKISTAKLSSKSRFCPKAFTEKGLYMLATILKSPIATQATLAIIETFTKVRDLKHTMSALIKSPDETGKKSLIRKSGEIISELMEDELQTSDTETTIELNFAVLKLKHTVKRKKSD